MPFVTKRERGRKNRKRCQYTFCMYLKQIDIYDSNNQLENSISVIFYVTCRSFRFNIGLHKSNEIWSENVIKNQGLEQSWANLVNLILQTTKLRLIKNNTYVHTYMDVRFWSSSCNVIKYILHMKPWKNYHDPNTKFYETLYFRTCDFFQIVIVTISVIM